MGSLRIKYGVSIFALVLAVSLILGIGVYFRFKPILLETIDARIRGFEEELIQKIESKGFLITTFLAEDLINPIYYNNMENIFFILHAAAAQPDLDYARVYDINGELIHDGTPMLDFAGSVLEKEFLEIVFNEDLPKTRKLGNNLEIAHAVRLGEENLGVVLVGMSLSGIPEETGHLKTIARNLGEEGLKRSILSLAGVWIAILAVSVLFAILLANRLTRPITILAEQAKRVGAGDYDIDVSVHQADEIGYLAKSFQEMVDSLRKTTISKEYAEGIFSNMNDSLIITTHDGYIQTVNRAACRLIGYSEESVIGLPIHQIFFEGKVGSSPVSPKRIREVGTVSNIQMEVETQDGRLVPVLISASLIRNPENEFPEIVYSAQDITQLKLTENKLILAKEKAEAANLAKSEFLSVATHELRTPLNAIVGFSDLALVSLKKSKENAEIRENLKIILNSGNHLLDIVTKVLELSKMESGDWRIAVDTHDVSALVREVIEAEKEKIEKNHNELILDFDDRPDLIKVDKTKLYQVLSCILDNAAKFTTDGKITLGYRRENGDGTSWLKFTVEDTGIGIPGDKIDKVFDYFYQVDSSSTRQYEGLGLGLALSKKYCDLMKGDISIISKVGKGTTVTVRLPDLPLVEA